MLAILGRLGFVAADAWARLVAAKVLIAVGASACLMGPLTGCRRHLASVAQLRAKSGTLISGRLAMVTSTTPFQWLSPAWGRRGLFVGLAIALAVSIVSIHWLVPSDSPHAASVGAGPGGQRDIQRYWLFKSLASLGFCAHGGMNAAQPLWAGP